MDKELIDLPNDWEKLECEECTWLLENFGRDELYLAVSPVVDGTDHAHLRKVLVNQP